MSPQYMELQLDALRELANIGSGTAATALSSMLGRPVGISVPTALALPMADAVETVGPPEAVVSAVILPLVGDLEAIALLLMSSSASEVLSELLGVEPGTEMGRSALGEIGNILGTSYVGALGQMTGLSIEPTPPVTMTDMLGAILASALATAAEGDDEALLLDSKLDVDGAECALTFMLVPAAGGVTEILDRLGLAG